VARLVHLMLGVRTWCGHGLEHIVATTDVERVTCSTCVRKYGERVRNRDAW